MGFTCKPEEEYSFDSLKSLREYIIVESANTEFIDIEDYFKNKAVFVDDEYFGWDKKWLTFSEEGFQQFCNRFRIPYYFIQNISEKDLTAKALNDYINHDWVIKELLNSKFVIDKSMKKIRGIVSKSYVHYSNKDFLDNIEKAYPKIFQEYDIAESYIINTKLYLRLLSKKIKAGYARGKYLKVKIYHKLVYS